MSDWVKLVPDTVPGITKYEKTVYSGKSAADVSSLDGALKRGPSLERALNELGDILRAFGLKNGLVHFSASFYRTSASVFE